MFLLMQRSPDFHRPLQQGAGVTWYLGRQKDIGIVAICYIAPSRKELLKLQSKLGQRRACQHLLFPPENLRRHITVLPTFLRL